MGRWMVIGGLVLLWCSGAHAQGGPAVTIHSLLDLDDKGLNDGSQRSSSTGPKSSAPRVHRDRSGSLHSEGLDVDDVEADHDELQGG